MHTCLTFSVLLRTARSDDLRPVHQGHGDIRPSDDVFHHSARGLLHGLDLWRWHDADAVVPAHSVHLSLHHLSDQLDSHLFITLKGSDTLGYYEFNSSSSPIRLKHSL